MPPEKKRQLAAIMFTDMEGYTALMQQNEAAALKQRAKHREIFESSMEEFGGKILQYFGDGTLSIFDSAVDAVRSGIAMQHRFLEGDTPIPVRIGIQTGDIIYSSEDIIGDGVNVASRIESLAVPGSVFISGKVFDELKNQPDINARFMGVFELKNVKTPVEVYAISDGVLTLPDAKDIHGKGKLISLKGEILTAEGQKGRWLRNQQLQEGNKGRIALIALLSLLVIAMGSFLIKQQFFQPTDELDTPAITMDSTETIPDTLLTEEVAIDSVKEEPVVLADVEDQPPRTVVEPRRVPTTPAPAPAADAGPDSLELAATRIDSLKNLETSSPLGFLELTADKGGLFNGYNALGETVIEGSITSTATYATYVDIMVHIVFFSEENDQVKEYFRKIENVISPGEVVELKLRLRPPGRAKTFEIDLVSADGLLRN